MFFDGNGLQKCELLFAARNISSNHILDELPSNPLKANLVPKISHREHKVLDAHSLEGRSSKTVSSSKNILTNVFMIMVEVL